MALFRVELLPPMKGEDTKVVCVPRKSISLPGWVKGEKVYYFPPQSEDARSLILVESSTKTKEDQATKNDDPTDSDNPPELPETASRLHGFYVCEDADLGGWLPSSAIEELKPESAKGSLEQKMDKFDRQDDCC